MTASNGTIRYPLVFTIASYQANQLLRPQLKQALSAIAPARAEAINNGLRAGGPVVMTLRSRGNTLGARIKDHGPGFNGNARLQQLEDDLFCYFDENCKDCGRGLGIMKAFCRLVRYNRVGNEVLLIMDITN